MYLLDTNIWLERLLDQARTAEVEQFLNQISAEQIFITDFTLHSIALALTRRKLFVALTAFNQRYEPRGKPRLVFRPKGRGMYPKRFIQDLFIDGTVNLLTLPPSQLIHLPEIMEQQKLDYDDAYQYYLAQQNQLILISFDTDFDHTTIGRKTPIEILETLSTT